MAKKIKFKKIYWLKNFSNEKDVLTLPEDKVTEEQLKEYNEKGYNIYQTVNTFTGDKRTIKKLAEIRACFIDIDYTEIVDKDMSKEERAEFIKSKYTEVQVKLKKIKELYNIEPSVINLTYKGFHILFNYSEDCYFIDENIHQEINNNLIEILGGDQNAKDLARVYKVPGFYDWKGGKRGKIKSLLENHSNITEPLIEHLVGNKASFRNCSKLNSTRTLSEKNENIRNANIEKINNLDAHLFIGKLKEIFLKKMENLESGIKESLFTKEVLTKSLNKLKVQQNSPISFSFLEEDGITLTSGLTLNLENEIWKINDYSKKTRRGNYNFLKNWILKDLNIDYTEFMKLLYKATSLTLSSNLEKKSQMGGQLLWADHYDRMGLNNEGSVIEVDSNNPLELAVLDKDTQKAYKNQILKCTEQQGFKKIFRGLFIYVFENMKNLEATKGSNGRYRIPLNDLLEASFGLLKKSEKDTHRTYIKEILLQMTGLTIPIKEVFIDEKGKEKTTNVFKHIMELSHEEGGGRKGEEKIGIKFLIPIQYVIGNPAFTNKHILQYQPGFKDTRITEFFLEIDDILNNTNNTYSKSLEETFKFLGYTSSFSKNKEVLKRHLIKAVEKGYFKTFKLTKETLYISKFNNINL